MHSDARLYRQVWCICRVKAVWSIPESFRDEVLTMGAIQIFIPLSFLQQSCHAFSLLKANTATKTSLPVSSSSVRPAVRTCELHHLNESGCWGWGSHVRQRLITSSSSSRSILIVLFIPVFLNLPLRCHATLWKRVSDVNTLTPSDTGRCLSVRFHWLRPMGANSATSTEK